MQQRAVRPISGGCDGDTVATITIRAHPPRLSTSPQDETRDAASRMIGLPHVNTREAVIRSYLRVALGKVCTELDRRESERLLRALPFVAAADVRATPETPGRIRVDVDVVDEQPLVAGGSFRRSTVASAGLGSLNLRGRGLSVVAAAERGFAYRDGFGIHARQYGLLGQPAYADVIAERRAVIGERFGVEVAAPFLTDLQLRAFHANVALESGYSRILRPETDEAAVFVRHTSYDIGWVTRFGRASGRGAVGVIGAALIGEDIRVGDDLVIVADTGLARGLTNPFGDEYPDFAITRLAVISGMRALRYTTARGFDALTAEQDMGVGVQLGLLVGPGLLTSGHTSDVLVAGEVYAGTGDAQSFLLFRGRAETRGDRTKRAWDGVAVTGRLAMYSKPSAEHTRIVTLDASAVHESVYPLQLTFRDPDAGLPGYGGSTLAGGRRVVMRFDERRLVRPFGARADVAVGAFAAAGALWAGDVPFSTNTGFHGSAGVSLLAAYPAGGKRTYRLDLAFPFDAGRARTHAELRISVSARAGSAWVEPRDVARARTGAVPVSLLRW